jgi:triacylglycerol lipase
VNHPNSPARTRKTLGALAVAGAALAGTVAFGASPASAAPKVSDPVLFVHGFTGASSNWGAYLRTFAEDTDRYPADRLFTINYNSFAPNTYTAYQIQAKVRSILAETGAEKVDIVAHSMGAFGSRYYLKNLGGTAYVDDFVSLGGPNHGTTTTNTVQCGFIPSCVEMRPGSAFLTALNEGDETPGDVDYATIRTPIDELVVPSASTELDGAQNRLVKDETVTHIGLLTDADTIERTYKLVR